MYSEIEIAKLCDALSAYKRKKAKTKIKQLIDIGKMHETVVGVIVEIFYCIDNFDNVFFYLVELFHIRPFSYHWIRSYSRHLTASFLILISISYSCQLYLA